MKVLLYPSLVAMPIAFGILALAQTRAQMIAAGVLFGIGLGNSFPAFMTFIVQHTDEQRRGRTFGSVILAFDTGIGLGSLVIAFIGGHAGFTAAFGLAAVLSCLAIPIFITTSRQLATR
jgi:cyanate permease